MDKCSSSGHSQPFWLVSAPVSLHHRGHSGRVQPSASVLFRLVSTLAKSEQAAGFTKTQTPLFQHHSQGVQPVRIWLASTPSRLGAQWGHSVSAHAQADSLQQGPASREEPIATSKGQPPKIWTKKSKSKLLNRLYTLAS